MRHTLLGLMILVAGCTPPPEVQIEDEFSQRIQGGGLTGAALADAYIDRGILYLATEKPDSAIADFNLAISASPDLAEAYVWRGVAMSGKNDEARAREDYRHALAIDPDYWFAHGNSGLAMAKAKEDDAALAELARAIELGMPHRGEYFVQETRYRRYTEVSRRGVAYTTKVPVELAVSTTDQLAIYRLTRAQIFLNRSDRESALTETRHVVRLEPDSSAVRWSLTKALTAVGECEEAKKQAAQFTDLVGVLLMAMVVENCPAPSQP